MIVQNATERKNLIEGGKRLAGVLAGLRAKIVPGVTAEELDDFAEAMIREGGDKPAFLGYTPEGARRPYPATLCVSINDEVVHGIPNESKKILTKGDIAGLDLGLIHNGVVVDAAITVPVGEIDDRSKRLIAATEHALTAGVRAAMIGGRIGDISAAIQEVIENAGFAVVRELGGHGVGDHVHEEPFVANFGKTGTGPTLIEGMVLALEPIAAAGKAAVILSPDGYTYRTKDGSRSSHVEHTILLEKNGARIITG